MTSQALTITTEQRRAWLAVLARASLSQLQALAPESLPAPQYIRAAEIGMVMLRARTDGTGDAFNLGEASVTRCALRLNGGPLGVGYTLGRDRSKAELIAVFDALLQDPQQHAELHAAVIETLAAAQVKTQEALGRATAESRVEFFTFVRGGA